MLILCWCALSASTGSVAFVLKLWVTGRVASSSWPKTPPHLDGNTPTVAASYNTDGGFVMQQLIFRPIDWWHLDMYISHRGSHHPPCQHPQEHRGEEVLLLKPRASWQFCLHGCIHSYWRDHIDSSGFSFVNSCMLNNSSNCCLRHRFCSIRNNRWKTHVFPLSLQTSHQHASIATKNQCPHMLFTASPIIFLYKIK